MIVYLNSELMRLRIVLLCVKAIVDYECYTIRRS